MTFRFSKRRIKNITSWFLLLTMFSCVTVNQIEDGKTVGKDKGEFGVSIHNGGKVSDLALQDTVFGLPSVELIGKYGLSDRLEIGGKIDASGNIGLSTKFQFLGNQTSIIASSLGVDFGGNVFPYVVVEGIGYYLSLNSNNSIHVHEKVCIFMNPKYLFSGFPQFNPKRSENYKSIFYTYGLIIGQKNRFGIGITHGKTMLSKPRHYGFNYSLRF